ncbi:MAG: hypothetical protein F4176_10015 [Acidimicrobiia bacterium]|nr:hypothetical protein [Acidimicrobiia bacterium]
MSRLLHLVELGIPLHHRFSNSRAAISERRVVLVGITEDGITGWGEAAPYPGYTPETVGDVWEALAATGGGVFDGDRSGIPATASAALGQARTDLAARRDGIPLWSYLNGSGQPSTACAAIGLQESPDRLVVGVERMIEAGARQVKIKIEPGRDVVHLRAVRERFPGLTVAADANGSYRPDDPALAALDDLGLAYLEQPLPACDLDGHAGLRRRMATPICLDEPATTAEAVERIIEQDAADLVSLKPGILGPVPTLRAIDMLSSAGVDVKIGGLVETSVGRAHALALAARPSVSYTDLVPPTWLLAADPSPQAWEVVDGRLFPLDEHGLEVTTGDPPVSDYVKRSARIAV